MGLGTLFVVCETIVMLNYSETSHWTRFESFRYAQDGKICCSLIALRPPLTAHTLPFILYSRSAGQALYPLSFILAIPSTSSSIFLSESPLSEASW